MLLTNIAASDKLSGSIILSSAFTITTPPSTRSFTFKFTSLYNVSNIYYDMDTISTIFQNNPGVISSVTVTPADTSINAVTSYTLNFQLTNKMVSGGYI